MNKQAHRGKGASQTTQAWKPNGAGLVEQANKTVRIQIGLRGVAALLDAKNDIGSRASAMLAVYDYVKCVAKSEMKNGEADGLSGSTRTIEINMNDEIGNKRQIGTVGVKDRTGKLIMKVRLYKKKLVVESGTEEKECKSADEIQKALRIAFERLASKRGPGIALEFC